MVSRRSQSDVNLKMATDDALGKAIPIIESKLAGHFAGDYVSVDFVELHLVEISSESLLTSIVNEICHQYTDAGWNVQYIRLATPPHLIFN